MVSGTGYLTETSFDGLDICEPIKKALEEGEFSKLTEIQAEAIPRLLAGHDVMGAAKTGSGKTLAFVIPALDLLYRLKVTSVHGTVVLVICPTRELAVQTCDVFAQIGAHIAHSFGTVIGGVNRREEQRRLEKGVNVVVATPGRLRDHMTDTKSFNYHNVQLLVIDEADRILDIGFEKDLEAILTKLPKKRQTCLFSATLTTKVEDLARLSLKNPTIVRTVTEDSLEAPTVEGLSQGYVVCPPARRLVLLHAFLKKKGRKSKIMVFFSTCKSVEYHEKLLSYLEIPNIIAYHGQKKQSIRLSALQKFSNSENSIMLCTDVAARGLDIPKVDWIIQYDPPDDPVEYIHRVGRTSRGGRVYGAALMFLMPEEVGFLLYLKKNKINVEEFTFNIRKLEECQANYEKMMKSNSHLYYLAKDAFSAYLNAYSTHKLKDVFSIPDLDVVGVGRAFGFEVPPRVELPELNNDSRSRRRKRTQLETTDATATAAAAAAAATTTNTSKRSRTN